MLQYQSILHTTTSMHITRCNTNAHHTPQHQHTSHMHAYISYTNKYTNLHFYKKQTLHPPTKQTPHQKQINIQIITINIHVFSFIMHAHITYVCAHHTCTHAHHTRMCSTHPHIYASAHAQTLHQNITSMHLLR